LLTATCPLGADITVQLSRIRFSVFFQSANTGMNILQPEMLAAKARSFFLSHHVSPLTKNSHEHCVNLYTPSQRTYQFKESIDFSNSHNVHEKSGLRSTRMYSIKKSFESRRLPLCIVNTAGKVDQAIGKSEAAQIGGKHLF